MSQPFSDTVAFLRAQLRLALGSASARQSLARSRAQAHDPAAGIAAFMTLSRAAETPGTEDPIFLFSAGWRSGSTLLQRLVSSDERVLIWGEAYDRAGLVQRLAQSLAPFGESWPPSVYYHQPELDEIAQSWMANLYPPPEAMLSGYRALLLELFARPARELGATRWGCKEVRFGRAEALLLKGLFPNGKFLFIRRGLEEAYLSYRSFSAAMDWYGDWPDRPVFTAYGFARHWARLTREFDAAVVETGGLLIDYENLVSGRVYLAEISAYSGTKIDGAVLRRRIGSGTSREGATVGPLEQALLRAGRR